jgi:hypothetical protein
VGCTGVADVGGVEILGQDSTEGPRVNETPNHTSGETNKNIQRT